MNQGDEDARRAAYAYGLRAETVATLWLRARLYTILARNYRVHGGEVDIIAKRGRTIAFVEVKARADLDSAFVAITPQKTATLLSRRGALARDKRLGDQSHAARGCDISGAGKAAAPSGGCVRTVDRLTRAGGAPQTRTGSINCGQAGLFAAI